MSLNTFNHSHLYFHLTFHILTAVIGLTFYSISPFSVHLSPGVSVCCVGERAERPLPRLPDRQQPDPNWTQDNRHGSDGGAISLRGAV